MRLASKIMSEFTHTSADGRMWTTNWQPSNSQYHCCNPRKNELSIQAPATATAAGATVTTTTVSTGVATFSAKTATILVGTREWGEGCDRLVLGNLLLSLWITPSSIQQLRMLLHFNCIGFRVSRSLLWIDSTLFQAVTDTAELILRQGPSCLGDCFHCYSIFTLSQPRWARVFLSFVTVSDEWTQSSRGGKSLLNPLVSGSLYLVFPRWSQDLHGAVRNLKLLVRIRKTCSKLTHTKIEYAKIDWRTAWKLAKYLVFR